MAADASPLMELDAVSCGHGATPVVRRASFRLNAGEVFCLLGPNGVGKTTLLKSILGILSVRGGRILIRGEDISAWTRRRFAAAVGYVPQAHAPIFAFRARDVVAMGRIAAHGLFARPSRHDMGVVDRALAALRIAHLADVAYTRLSGGQRQLVLIARALAQEADILIMDEPTASLDFGNQIMVLDCVRRLAREEGKAVVLTTHDPNHALLYASRVGVLSRDGSLRIGRPREVVTAEYLAATYGVASCLVRVPRPDGGDLAAFFPMSGAEPDAEKRPRPPEP